MARFVVDDEDTGLDCGFDYESFVFGYDCKNEATKVIIEGSDFHYAHLCTEHIEEVLRKLEQDYGYSTTKN